MASMLLRPTIGPVNVRIFDGLPPDGDEMRLAKITTLGDSAKLYQWDGKNFHEYDRLTECVFNENNDGTLTISGVSEQMLDDAQLPPGEARVRWEVTIVDCPSCT